MTDWHLGYTVVVIAFLLASLIREWIAPDVSMLTAVVALTLGGVIGPADAFGGFADPALLTVAALFVVAAGLRNSQALSFAYPLMAARSPSIPAAVGRLMLPAAAVSAFVNNTPIVAILAPLVQRWAAAARISPSKLLIPMTYATTLGGMVTLIGTSTNVMVAGLLVQNGYRPLGFWELAVIGIPATAAGILYFATVGHRLLPDHRSALEADRWELRSYQFELRVRRGSPLAGCTVEEGRLRALSGAFLAHLLREGEIIGPVAPEQVLHAGDVLAFVGNPKVLDDLVESGELERVVTPVDQAQHRHLPLFEAVVSAASSLVGRSLRDADFRERYQAVVLGIHRQGRRVEGPIGRIEIEAGDLLLIEARPGFEASALPTGDFYLVAPLERSENGSRRRAPIAAVILAAVILLGTFSTLPLVSIAIAAAVATILFGVINPSEARRSVDLSVLIVIASGLAIGAAIERSGLAELIAGGIVGLTLPLGAIGVIAGVYIATNLLTEFLSNTAAAVLMFPIGMAAAADAGGNPMAFAVTIAIAASAGFATPIGYQTNLMIMGPGNYRFLDYVKAGLPLNIIVGATAIPIIAWVW